MLLDMIYATDQGRLAGTRWPAEYNPFALCHAEIDIAQGIETTKPLHKVLHHDDRGRSLGLEECAFLQHARLLSWTSDSRFDPFRQAIDYRCAPVNAHRFRRDATHCEAVELMTR